jgi:hypothetical protein
LLVDSDKPSTTLWRRRGSSFEPEAYLDAQATIPLPEIGVEVPFSDVYAGVDWTAAPTTDLENDPLE